MKVSALRRGFFLGIFLKTHIFRLNATLIQIKTSISMSLQNQSYFDNQNSTPKVEILCHTVNSCQKVPKGHQLFCQSHQLKDGYIVFLKFQRLRTEEFHCRCPFMRINTCFSSLLLSSLSHSLTSIYLFLPSFFFSFFFLSFFPLFFPPNSSIFPHLTARLPRSIATLLP